MVYGKGRHHTLLCIPSTVGNIRSILGGSSCGGVGALVRSRWTVGARLLSARMWISMLQNMPSKERH